MNGRQEHSIKIENKIKELIKDSPEIIQNYYYNFGDKTATTKMAYVTYILQFSKYFHDSDLTKLKRSDINKYMDSIRYRNVNGELKENGTSIRNAKLSAIKDFYTYLCNDNIIEDNPAITIKPPKSYEEHPITALTPKEIKKIKNNIKNGIGSDEAKSRQRKWRSRDLAIVTLGCSTGIRCSALTEINISDIDFESNTIRVIEKGNKERRVCFGENTALILKDWIKDRALMDTNNKDALFISNRKERITQYGVTEILKKYTANIDKHITPHKMRSSCATNLYEKTGDIYLVQDVLGHKNIANTRRYAKMSDKKRQYAAQILDNL